MDIIEVGLSLKEARRRINMTQIELADASGVSLTILGELERGLVNDIGLKGILRIAEALNLDMSFRPSKSGYTLEDAKHDNQFKAYLPSGFKPLKSK